MCWEKTAVVENLNVCESESRPPAVSSSPVRLFICGQKPFRAVINLWKASFITQGTQWVKALSSDSAQTPGDPGLHKETRITQSQPSKQHNIHVSEKGLQAWTKVLKRLMFKTEERVGVVFHTYNFYSVTFIVIMSHLLLLCYSYIPHLSNRSYL